MSAQQFGDRLAQLRREKAAAERADIDHRTVAKAVGASPASVSRWENGEVYPGDDYLAKLAAFYGVTRSWLRYGEGQRSAEEAITDEVVAGPAPRKKPHAVAPATARKKGAR